MHVRDLRLRLRALLSPHRVERELDEELAFHVEREAQKLAAAGMTPAEARARALARFGSLPLAADQCRDVRGTGFVDDLWRDIQYAFRTFSRAPLAALTIVATVALGLGLVTVVFAVFNALFLRPDAVRNPGELFAVERATRPGANSWLPFSRREYETMRRETNVFTDVTAMLPAVRVRVDGRPGYSHLVAGNFFQVLGVPPALGRPLTADDDDRGAPVIVLSHPGWHKLFAADPSVVGGTVRINGRLYDVVGVMPEGFRGLALAPPDYWAPLTLVGQFREADANKEDETAVDVVARLKPGVSPQAATVALRAWAAAHSELKGRDRPATFITLRPRQGTLMVDKLEALLGFAPLFFAFGLILAIGCANVANLLLARGVTRQREIGIRLSLGASRRRIVRQLLTEALLLALAAAGCGVIVSRAFLEGAIRAVTSTVPAEMMEPVNLLVAPTADWRVVMFIVAGAVLSTAFFALAPALQATRLELVRVMRGELTREARPARPRQTLIAIQVGASALLLICAAVFLRGALASALVDPGIRTSDTVRVAIANESRREALLREATADPLVADVAASSQPALAIAEMAETAASSPPVSRRVPIERTAVSPEYFEVLGIDVVRGRAFEQTERGDEAGVAIVTETAAHRLWPNSNAVGQQMRLHTEGQDLRTASSSRAVTVVGVVRDLGGGLQFPDLFTFRGVYVPTSPENAGTALTLRVRGDPEQVRLALLERLTRVDPGLGTITTLRAFAGMQTYILRLVFRVTVVLGGLALLLTVSGLFSVLSYVVEQRAKDIGVRKALGATTRNVVGLVLSQSARPIGIGLLSGGGLAAALAIVLMSTAAASQIGGIVRVFDPVAYAGSVLVIATACLLAISLPTLRAARIDPMATLRSD
jgi:predicted permease